MLASSAAPSSAQEPPALLPASPPSHVAVFQVEAPAPAQYDEALSVQDFEPNAWTYERRHEGMAFFSVVDGAVTVRKDGKDTVYGKGQSFRQDAGVYYSIGNKANARRA
jgi:quercetin dioxygenase-like cupin family protein